MRNPLLKLPAPRILRKQVFDSAPGWRLPLLRNLIPNRPGHSPPGLNIHTAGGQLAAAKGWQRLKTGDEGEHLDYFTLCLACHHSSVATFVPTDVDSKIRDHLWRYASTPKLLRKMVDICLHMRNWDLDGARTGT